MKKLWILPDAGLGNRLNCIYSGLYYRKKFDCELKWFWDKTDRINSYTNRGYLIQGDYFNTFKSNFMFFFCQG